MPRNLTPGQWESPRLSHHHEATIADPAQRPHVVPCRCGAEVSPELMYDVRSVPTPHRGNLGLDTVDFVCGACIDLLCKLDRVRHTTFHAWLGCDAETLKRWAAYEAVYPRQVR